MENKAATMENGEIPEDANERKLFLLCYQDIWLLVVC
jgi:hypothetical protein